MVVNLKVIVDPGQGWYSSGQEVTGRVVAEVNRTTACKAILTKVRCCSFTLWTDDDDNKRSDAETHFEQALTVWSGRDYGDNLAQGEHSFPFSFWLPLRVPSSFEGKYGHVRYEVEAQTEQAWADIPATAKDTFKVITAFDLTQEAAMSDRLDLYEQDSICCCCCKEGPITVSLYAEKTGYIPGEYMLISGVVENGTETPIDNAVITIHETIKYHAQGKTKTKTTELSNKRRGGFAAGTIDLWENVPIYIPKTAACIRFTRLIEVTHCIKVQFNLGFISDVNVVKDIVLGHIPVGKVTQSIDGEPAPPDTDSSTHPTSGFAITQQPTSFGPPIPQSTGSLLAPASGPPYTPPTFGPHFPSTSDSSYPAFPPSSVLPPSAPYKTPSPSASPCSTSAATASDFPCGPGAPNAPPASPYGPQPYPYPAPAPNAPPASPYAPPHPSAPVASVTPYPSGSSIQDLPPPPSYSSVVEEDKMAQQLSDTTRE